MPHLIVEYSRNLADFREAQALTALNQAVTSGPEGVLAQLSVEVVDMNRGSYTKVRL